MVCMKRLDDERFIVERDDSIVVTLRIKSSVLDKYEKLTALVKTIDPNIQVTRSRVMRLVLERAVEQLLRDPRVLLIMLRNE
jgi:DNA-binding MurR/RpiR family transcriptional regulator